MKDLILDAIKGREFELALRYCGLTEGQRGDKEHHQPCPFCTDPGKDRFRFYPAHGTFHCRQCGFDGKILKLLMATNGITERKALETLASETGILLPKRPKRTQRSPIQTAYERNQNDARMTIAMLLLAHLRFVPGTDGIDFEAATIETTRRYAETLTEYPLYQLVGLLATERCAGDRQKAWAALDCLYNGTDPKPRLREINFNRTINEIRIFTAKEHQKLEMEIAAEIERTLPCQHQTK